MGIYGSDPVYDWLVHSNDDETVGAELEARCRGDLGLDDKAVYKPEVEPVGKPADVLAGEPAGKPDCYLPKKKRRTTHSGGAKRHGRARDEPENGEIKRSSRGAM